MVTTHNLADVKYGVLCCPILGSLLFLIYINDLRVNNNEQVNHDLEILANLLKTSKISLNVGKTELLLFTSPKKQLDCDLKIKLNGKRLYETHSVKYFGNSNWQKHNMETTS